ncbi:AP-3 complex subunit delta-1 [Schistosoma japonicum]|nr:AP-3 complex subunit delta-1 [Schistosoma japonicum]
MMALSVVKGKLERVLDKNPQDLVRGIRKHGVDEAKYIGQCLDEIKSELKDSSFSVKANAISKLLYIQMLGYDISWAVFNIVEIMSSQKFTFKRIGYLAASQSFHSGTDVLMLATNLIRKDLMSSNLYDAGIALSGVACFINPDLATDLHSDILSLMNSPNPYLRKKAVLLLYRVFLNYPEALRICFSQLKDKLDDPDPGVQSAAVNVICELARKNPKNYLSLSPIFFKLMTTSSNNWVLIKIIKLFGTLTPLEPRLGKKLIGPLTNLIHSTSAMSLLYECINTVVAVLISISSGIPSHQASIQLCVQKLRILIEDSDQNLKYLGLLAMRKILLYHPQSVQPHKDLILSCLDDKDESIRLRALDLLHGMVSKTNLMDIVKHLMIHIGNLSSGLHYRNELISKVVYICSQDNYHNVASFEWYVTILVELASIDGIRNGELLASQLMDVSIRVPTVRAFCVEQMAILLDLSQSLTSGGKQNAIHETLRAAAWICGEYANSLNNPEQTLNSIVSLALELPGLSSSIQAVLIFNAFKIYNVVIRNMTSKVAEDLSVTSITNRKCQESCTNSIDNNCNHAETIVVDQVTSLNILHTLIAHLIELSNFMMNKLSQYVHSSDLEVQERVVSIHQVLSLVSKRFIKIQSFLCSSSTLQHNPSSFILANDSSPSLSNHHQSLDNLDSHSHNPSVVTACFDNNTGVVRDIGLHSPSSSVQMDTLPALTSAAVSPSVVINLIQTIVDELNALFSGEIIPVAPKAQKKVPIPEGLDLDAWINPPVPISKQSWNNAIDFIGKSASDVGDHSAHWNKKPVNVHGDIFTNLQDSAKSQTVKLTSEQLDEMRSKRLQSQQNNPNYLKPVNFKNSNAENILNEQQPDAVSSVSKAVEQLSLNGTDSNSLVGAQQCHTQCNSARKLASSDQFAAEIRKKFQTTAAIEERRLRSATGNKSKKLHKKKRTPSPLSSPSSPLSLNDLKSKNQNEATPKKNEVDHHPTPDKRASRIVVRCDYDAPEGVTIDNNESPSDSENANDPHHQLNIVLDNFITQDNNNTKLIHFTPPRLDKNSSAHKTPNKSLKLSSKFSNISPILSVPCNKPINTETQFCLSSSLMNNEIFTSLLSTGQLNSFKSSKIQCPNLLSIIHQSEKSSSVINANKIFAQILSILVKKVPCSIIESLDNRAASFYTEHIPLREPLCILMKISFTTGIIRIDIRSTNENAVHACTAHLTNLVKQMNIDL